MEGRVVGPDPALVDDPVRDRPGDEGRWRRQRRKAQPSYGAASLRDVAHGAWPGAHERDGAVKRVAEQPAHIAEHLVIPERVAP